jgi:hypothetical protein
MGMGSPADELRLRIVLDFDGENFRRVEAIGGGAPAILDVEPTVPHESLRRDRQAKTASGLQREQDHSPKLQPQA